MPFIYKYRTLIQMISWSRQSWEDQSFSKTIDVVAYISGLLLTFGGQFVLKPIDLPMYM